MTTRLTPLAFDTWGADVSFAVRVHESGNPWIIVQGFIPPELPILRVGDFLGFETPDGTTVDEAEALVRNMNQMISAITFTGDMRPEFIGHLGAGAKGRLADGGEGQVVISESGEC